MRITLRQQLADVEGQLKHYREANAKLEQEKLELTLQSRGLQTAVKDLLRQADELKEECNRHRRNRVIAEARMAGFVEATALFVKGGKVGPDGQN